jgi:hypothetical protein
MVTRSRQDLLFEVDPSDLSAFAADLVLLGTVALLACFVDRRGPPRLASVERATLIGQTIPLAKHRCAHAHRARDIAAR